MHPIVHELTHRPDGHKRPLAARDVREVVEDWRRQVAPHVSRVEVEYLLDDLLPLTGLVAATLVDDDTTRLSAAVTEVEEAAESLRGVLGSLRRLRAERRAGSAG